MGVANDSDHELTVHFRNIQFILTHTHRFNNNSVETRSIEYHAGFECRST